MKTQTALSNVIFFAGLFTLVSSEVYYVRPSSSDPCPEKETKPCLTISQYANQSSDSFAFNTTLILLPGIHQLEGNFSVLGDKMKSFQMLSDTDKSAPIVVCQNDSSFQFEAVEYVFVSQLLFIGCTNILIQTVPQFVFINSTFANGSGEHTLLMVDSNVLIQETIIRDTNVTEDCGVLIAINSVLVFENSVITDNTIQLLSESPRCLQYIHYPFNLPSIVLCKNSNVTYITTKFLLNRSSLPMLGAENSTISMQNTSFTSNSCTGTCIAFNFLYHNALSVLDSTFYNNSFTFFFTSSAGYTDMLIGTSNFVQNSIVGSLIRVYGHITISGTRFEDNIMLGGIYFNGIMYSKLRNFVSLPDNGTLAIHNTIFTNNVFLIGLITVSSDSSVFVRLVIQNSRFDHNMMDINGLVTSGVETKALVVIEAAKIRPVIANFENVQFISNYGKILYSLNSIILSSNTIVRDNVGASFDVINSNVTFASQTTFENNTNEVFYFAAYYQGGAVTCFQSDITFVNGAILTHNTARTFGGAIYATECKIDILNDTMISHNRANYSGGGIYAVRSEIIIQGKLTEIINNEVVNENGGAVYASGTTIKLQQGTIVIGNNTAPMGKGGGCYLDSNSRLYIIKSEDPNGDANTNIKVAKWLLEFSNNSAELGGAIYVVDDSYSGTCENINLEQGPENTRCFFQVFSTFLPAFNDHTVKYKNIIFVDNQASQAGDDLYGGLLDRCSISPFTEAYKKQIFFSYAKNGISYLNLTSNIDITAMSVTSDAVRVCFCNENDTPDCNLFPRVRVLKGREFEVRAVAVDQAKNPVPATVNSYLQYTSINVGAFGQKTNKTCTDLTYNFLSPNWYEEVTVYAKGPCGDNGLSKKSFIVIFDRCTCPSGFQKLQVLNNCSCECDPRLTSYISCMVDTETVRRKEGLDSWITHSDTGRFVAYPHCPFDYCYSPSENLAHIIDFNTNNSLCVFNRTGKICGSCEDGLSLTLGSSQCKPCSNYWLFLLIPFALGGIVLVGFLLVCNLTTAVGTINGFVFYANIVVASPSTFFPYTFQKPIFLYTFMSWLNLDLGIETCLFDGMDAYTYTWLQLVFPVYIIFLVIAVIILSEYSGRFTRLISIQNPVATLSTLILLSYAKLLRIVIRVFQPAKLQHIDSGTTEVVWLIDGNVPYLKGKHIYLFTAAVIIVILVFVYTIFLFSWQWFVHLPLWKIFNWVENTKLKSFMETYHAPFKPKHRYWAGVLLIARIILYVFMAINVHGDFRSNLLAIAIVVICLLMLSKKGVYKDGRFEVLETTFLVNLLIFVVTTFYARDINGNQTVVGYVSTGITFVLFCAILTYHTYKYMIKKKRCCKRQQTGSQLVTSNSTWSNNLEGEHEKPIGSKFTRLREPLDLIFEQPDTEDYSSASVTVAADCHRLNQAVTQTVIDGRPVDSDEDQ